MGTARKEERRGTKKVMNEKGEGGRRRRREERGEGGKRETSQWFLKVGAYVSDGGVTSATRSTVSQ